MAYWGPEIKVGVPQKALSINMDAATQHRKRLACSFQLAGRVMPIVYIQNPTNPCADSDSDPRHHAAQSAARR